MNTERANPAEANPGRDANGRFAAGNKGGPGNPFARQVAALRQALLESVSAQDIQDVAGRLLALAKDGNVPAAKLLLAYTIGKPQPAPEPDRLDADEWQVFKETTPMKQEEVAVMGAGDPESRLNVVRAMRPIVGELQQRKLTELLLDTPGKRTACEAAEFDRLHHAAPPSPNGVNGTPKPSPNGRNGTPAPRIDFQRCRQIDIQRVAKELDEVTAVGR